MVVRQWQKRVQHCTAAVTGVVRTGTLTSTLLALCNAKLIVKCAAIMEACKALSEQQRSRQRTQRAGRQQRCPVAELTVAVAAGAGAAVAGAGAGGAAAGRRRGAEAGAAGGGRPQPQCAALRSGFRK